MIRAALLLVVLPALALADGVAFCGATRVAMIGDSITNSNGLAHGEKLPDRLKLALGVEWIVDQYGIPGDSATACSARITSDLIPPRTTGLLPVYSYITILCGINDVNLLGASAATVWGRIQTMADNIIGYGIAAKPVLITLLPYKNTVGWTSGEQTILESVNASILAHCAANPTTVICVNAYPVMGEAADAAQLKAAYDSGDGLHLNVAGEDALSVVIASVLSSRP